MLAHWHLDVLLDGESRKQRALLKHHADAPLDRGMFLRRESIEILAKNLDKPAAFANSPKIVRVSTDLPVPDPPTKPKTSPR